MAIKVGNSYISEAAYAQAKAKIEQEQNTESGAKSSVTNYLNTLREKHPGANFTTSTQPFSGSGTNNIGISPRILSQVANDPEKRLEYEALIIDIKDIQKSLPSMYKGTGMKLIAHGTIIDENGGVSSWSITQTDDNRKESSQTFRLPKKNKDSWYDIMLKGLEKKGFIPNGKNSGVDIKA